ncbi:unnamed protein product [Caenorhabditis angaria]|uniref:C-type lectin domain-containing protein n=1 Tax=Caenorhabditis angaria TaxID=860376 RepID=A0A9P1IMA5_9PELO|nr:unnamed protein product [Caenorhabditis angaria]
MVKIFYFILIFSIITEVTSYQQQQEEEEDCIVETECPEGWRKFNRKMGAWCISLVVNGVKSQKEAQVNCERMGATLSGIESQGEYSYVQYKGNQINKNLNEVTWLWIGGKRRSECLSPKGSAAECQPMANNAFEWSDGVAVGTSQMRWAAGQPDNFRGNEDCLHMQFDQAQRNGVMNDYPCDQVAGGYLCGKRASILE